MIYFLDDIFKPRKNCLSGEYPEIRLHMKYYELEIPALRVFLGIDAKMLDAGAKMPLSMS